MKNIFKKLAQIPKDKLLHSFYGSLIFSLLLPLGATTSLTITIIIAALKEAYDQYDYNGADLKDFLFTIVIPVILTLNSQVF